MRRVVRTAALVAAIACLFAFFSVGSVTQSSTTGGGGARQSTGISIGQPWAWYESRLEQELRPDGSAAGSGRSGVIPDSPAWLLLAGAIGGIVVFRRLRPRPPAVALA
jgi:hypothetical protein